jgi:NAD(P)H dehydrogenase (quinone)
MKVLTVYAHPNPKSFCHAVLEQFTKGLNDAGHTNKVVDFYAIKFNPVLQMKDFANWLPDENAPDVRAGSKRTDSNAKYKLVEQACCMVYVSQ